MYLRNNRCLKCVWLILESLGPEWATQLRGPSPIPFVWGHVEAAGEDSRRVKYLSLVATGGATSARSHVLGSCWYSGCLPWSPLLISQWEEAAQPAMASISCCQRKQSRCWQPQGLPRLELMSEWGSRGYILVLHMGVGWLPETSLGSSQNSSEVDSGRSETFAPRWHLHGASLLETQKKFKTNWKPTPFFIW